MRFFSGWIGIACTVIGIICLVFYAELPKDNRISQSDAFLLIGVGVGFMYYGREFLPGWIGYFFTANGDESDN
ncbi:hypothetical protein MIB92_13200 [Aestuariirhabdus sp. Z084]|uniref:hypothetical protein n=1 Tax=Aestuariirhabdus haliotis TaxID=2918751 RepID=UPI00201B423F|nr:hypothetical protein [Aestuariirhabdus haliotis]MCL6416610.1 hypothetical protein [Aestuariirhabdus haliotis]MCL6420645.1 hypothetical protein [Aestuariirhabdus haliotis]